MTSPILITTHPQSISRPITILKRVRESKELGRKPKKVNSEIRRQQNRIASRNYRESIPDEGADVDANSCYCAGEKRKRKLQRLQQLINDESGDQKDILPLTEQLGPFARAVRTDCDIASTSPLMLLPNSGSGPVDSNNVVITIPTVKENMAVLESQSLTMTHAHSSLEPKWNNSLYCSPPVANMAWYNPQWTHDLEYTSRFAPQPRDFLYTTPSVQPEFEQMPTDHQPPQEASSSINLYKLYPSLYGTQY